MAGCASEPGAGRASLIAVSRPAGLRWRLSVLMFLLYAPAGAVLPLFTLHLKHQLQFEPVAMSWVCATQSLAALVAPVVAGQLADRWLPTQYCLAFCSFLAGVFIWFLPDLTSFPAVFGVSLAFWLFMTPALTLGTSLCFHHLTGTGGDFGPIRLWGTVGWVGSVWLLSWWFEEPACAQALRAWLRPDNPCSQWPDMFRLAAVLSVLLGVYSLTLPHTPPEHRGGPRLAPLAALGLLRQRSFAIYLAVTLGLVITFPFSSQVTPLLLEYLGLPPPWLCRTLTLAQSSEILLLALLPWLLSRYGTQRTMMLGLSGWTLAMTVLMVGWPLALVIGSLTLNGLCIGCFLVAGQVFVNRRASCDIRASAQGLFTLTTGLGNLIGNLLVGGVRRWVAEAFAPTFAVAASLALLLTGVFLVGFADPETTTANQDEPESLAV